MDDLLFSVIILQSNSILDFVVLANTYKLNILFLLMADASVLRVLSTGSVMLWNANN